MELDLRSALMRLRARAGARVRGRLGRQPADSGGGSLGELRARAGARVRAGLRRQPADSRGEPWQCACGQRYLVAGRGRHRIFWVEGAAEGDPVLSGRCPNCDRALPA